MRAIRKGRLRYFVTAYVAVFVMLSACGYLVMSGGKPMPGSEKSLGSSKIMTDLAYYDLPRITVSVSSVGNGLPPRIRADIALEVARKDMRYLASNQPRIMDKITNFMENVRPEDLELAGSAPQLRVDMLRAINNSGAPVVVHDLLFRQLVIM